MSLMSEHILEQLNRLAESVPRKAQAEHSGRLTRMVGLTLEAVGCQVVVGERCVIETDGDKAVEAEVVGFEGERIFLMPISSVEGLKPGDRKSVV